MWTIWTALTFTGGGDILFFFTYQIWMWHVFLISNKSQDIVSHWQKTICRSGINYEFFFFFLSLLLKFLFLFLLPSSSFSEVFFLLIFQHFLFFRADHFFSVFLRLPNNIKKEPDDSFCCRFCRRQGSSTLTPACRHICTHICKQWEFDLQCRMVKDSASVCWGLEDNRPLLGRFLKRKNNFVIL